MNFDMFFLPGEIRASWLLAANAFARINGVVVDETGVALRKS
ncbi:MAG: hypothetical protein RLP98_10985 [Devosia sp.]